MCVHFQRKSKRRREEDILPPVLLQHTPDPLSLPQSPLLFFQRTRLHQHERRNAGASWSGPKPIQGSAGHFGQKVGRGFPSLGTVPWGPTLPLLWGISFLGILAANSLSSKFVSHPWLMSRAVWGDGEASMCQSPRFQEPQGSYCQCHQGRFYQRY